MPTFLVDPSSYDITNEWKSLLIANRADAAIYDEASNLGCGLWWNDTPEEAQHRIGCIGALHGAGTATSSAQGILALASEELGQRGCTRIYAPIDGNTWRPYRLVSETSSEPTFLFEPPHLPGWQSALEQSGFQLSEGFGSSLQEGVEIDPRLQRARARFAANGLRIRGIDHSRLEEELTAVHGLCLEAFASNVLYTALSLDEFIEKYLPFREHMNPQLVLMAEDANGLCGFVFAIPDLLRPQRGAAMDTLLLKTLAIKSGRAYAGLGAVLLEDAQSAASKLGINRAILALMHDSNNSQNLRTSQRIRSYGLWAKDLVP